MAAFNTIVLLALLLCHVLKNANCREFAYNGLNGPEHWGEQYNTCGGKYQSPINIDVHHVVRRAFTELTSTRFFDKPSGGELLNNGHTVVVNLEFKGGPPTISGGPLEPNIFEFSQFHFHWGENNTVGSEDRINNQSYAAELHVVFRNVKYPTFAEAVMKSDGVAVLAFFYIVDEEDNPSYAEFTELLAHVQQPNMRAVFLKPPSLIDLITIDSESYFTYTGSLTTPPCSEDVTWIDFATPIYISTRQLERFRHLQTYDGIPLTHNFRPLQPLNDRRIYQPVPRIGDYDQDFMSAIPFLDKMSRNGGSTPALAAALTALSSLLLLAVHVVLPY